MDGNELIGRRKLGVHSHWAYMGLFALNRCKETIGSLLHELNAIFKAHIKRLRIIDKDSRKANPNSI